MIAIASVLPVLFLIIWLFTVRMPGPAFAGPLPPLTPNQTLIRSGLQRLRGGLTKAGIGAAT